MKTNHYDVFVIGSGIAGQTVAKKCVQNNLKVAIADKREFGGTCANRGCDPKKIIFQFTDLLEHTSRLKNVGIKKIPKLSWKKIQEYKTKFTNSIPISTEKKLTELGIDLYHQSPKFLNENEISVEGKTITAEYFVIATGKTAMTPNISGKELLEISDDILNLKKIPKSATFIGAGYVGIEFANMLAILGCKVTVIQKGDTILNQFDDFLVKELQKKLDKLSVNIIFNADVISVKKMRKNISLEYIIDKKKYQHKSRKIYSTIGRKPAVDLLLLDKANIEFDDSGVIVNDYLQSKTNKKVFACGDVSSLSLPLTPLSGLQGNIVANNILKTNSEKFNFPKVPSTVFTTPKLSAIGLSEDEAKKRYKNVVVYKGNVENWFNSRKSKQETYSYKIIINKRTDEIVGAQLLSQMANENINIFVLAINNKMKVSEYKKMIFTYPSFSSDLKNMFKDH